MTNSLQTLKLAHELRLAGDLPTDVSFWAVENPLIHSTDRLKQKVCLIVLSSMHAGLLQRCQAEVVLFCHWDCHWSTLCMAICINDCLGPWAKPVGA